MFQALLADSLIRLSVPYLVLGTFSKEQIAMGYSKELSSVFFIVINELIIIIITHQPYTLLSYILPV